MNSDTAIFCSFYNGKEFIDGYLQNLLEQSIFNKVSFYFLDCASPTNERESIEKLASKHSNINLKVLDSDPGLYEAWNICVNWIEEPILGNWNIDDRKSPWSLEVLRDALVCDPSLDLVYGKTYVSNQPNETFFSLKNRNVYPCLPHSFENLLANNSPHCMPLWRKRIHEKFGYFDNNLKTAADTDMWLRACKGGAKMRMINEFVGLYFENPKGRSTNPETLKEMVEEVYYVRDKYR